MSVLGRLKPKFGAGGAIASLRSWLSPLNLHWAGVGLLALVNVYLLAQMALLWHASNKYDANARAEQTIARKTAEIAAVPLRGLDAKLVTATKEADQFYAERLPGSDSEMLSELGALMKKAGVRLTRNSYTPGTVLAGTAGELTQVRMDATLGGDYRPLMQVVNSLERDKMFFVINRVTLTGQQTGTVNLRLGLTTYLRPTGSTELNGDTSADAATAGADAATPTAGAAQGGPGR